MAEEKEKTESKRNPRRIRLEQLGIGWLAPDGWFWYGAYGLEKRVAKNAWADVYGGSVENAEQKLLERGWVLITTHDHYAYARGGGVEIEHKQPFTPVQIEVLRPVCVKDINRLTPECKERLEKELSLLEPEKM